MAKLHDKSRNTAQSAKGKVKAAAGEATGNKKLTAKGKSDQAKASAKKTGERVKDALR